MVVGAVVPYQHAEGHGKATGNVDRRDRTDRVPEREVEVVVAVALHYALLFEKLGHLAEVDVPLI